LKRTGINIVVGGSISDHRVLRGDQRDFVNTFQPNRGLSPDTRGTPFGTIFPIGVSAFTPQGTIINSAGTAPFLPGSTTVRASGGINPLDLPGNLGCDAIDGQAAYDNVLWANATAEYACAWDTGQGRCHPAAHQDGHLYGRATIAPADDHIVYAEFTGSKADSAKRFSNIQIIPNATTNNSAFPRTAANAAVYDRVFNQLVATFPTLESRRGLPIGYRWRCIECGPRRSRPRPRPIDSRWAPRARSRADGITALRAATASPMCRPNSAPAITTAAPPTEPALRSGRASSRR
jgi:iron complex outermembrane recepter protein